MVFAHGEHFDVLDNDYIVIVLLEYGVAHNVCNS